MAGYSAVDPDEFVQCDGKWQFRYNITGIAATKDSPASWQYDFVEVQDLDRSVLIDALITARYSYASQLGKLALSRTSAEWTEYNAFRQACITSVDGALARR
jgi:hypothetical protein